MSIKSLLFNVNASDFALFGQSMLVVKLNANLNLEFNIRNKISDNPSKYDEKVNSITAVLKDNDLSALTRAFPSIVNGTYKNPGQQPGSKYEGILMFNTVDENQEKIITGIYNINNGVQITMTKGTKKISYQLFDMELERVTKIFESVIFLKDQLKLVSGYVKSLLMQACAKEEQYIQEQGGGNNGGGGGNWNKGGGGNWNKGGGNKGNWNKGGGNNNWNSNNNTNPTFNNHKSPEVLDQQQARNQQYNNSAINNNPNNFQPSPFVPSNNEVDITDMF